MNNSDNNKIINKSVIYFPIPNKCTICGEESHFVLNEEEFFPVCGDDECMKQISRKMVIERTYLC